MVFHGKYPFFILLMFGMVAQGVCQNSSSRQIVLSVADNTENSALTTSTILQVVNGQGEGDLIRELGNPTSAARFFTPLPQPEESDIRWYDEHHRAVLLAMDHYLVLAYSESADIIQIVDRLRLDGRFAFAAVESKGGFSSTPVPNDPYFFRFPSGPGPHPPWFTGYQWALQDADLSLKGAWALNTGWAHIGLADGGAPAVSAVGINPPWIIDHSDLQGVISTNHVVNLFHNNRDFTWSDVNRAHGTHVLGILAANTNNSIGTAGTCWNCSVLYAMLRPGNIMTPRAFTWLSYWGSQVINHSGFIYVPPHDPYATPDNTMPTVGLPCSAYGYGPGADPTCHSLALAKVLEVNIFAAAGNARITPIYYPASDASVIGVGGYDIAGNFWDESLWAPDTWDFSSGPNIGCPSFWTPTEGCGSNWDMTTDFVAPSRRILSSVPYGEIYGTIEYAHVTDTCSDPNFGLPDDGLAYCSGTSMSTPFVTAIAALVRSDNPLLGRKDTHDAIKNTASNAGIYDPRTAWGAPIADEAVRLVRGRSGGVVVKNRLTPMFALEIDRVEKGGQPNTRDRLYTTRPQVASGALSGWYLSYAQACEAGSTACGPSWGGPYIARHYRAISSAEAGVVHGYLAFPGFDHLEPTQKYQTKGSFHVFTAQDSPFSGILKIPLTPLYRLSFREACDWRDHVYSTSQAEIATLTTTDYCPGEPGIQAFHVDGIEGYILPSCPVGMSCNGSDTREPRKLFRRYSYAEDRNALVLESQLGLPVFSTYTTDAWGGGGSGLLGYVYPNIDSDLDSLIDGFEHILGTNHLSDDSDCDGIKDGIEYPLASLQPSGADPLLGGTCF